MHDSLCWARTEGVVTTKNYTVQYTLFSLYELIKKHCGAANPEKTKYTRTRRHILVSSFPILFLPSTGSGRHCGPGIVQVDFTACQTETHTHAHTHAHTHINTWFSLLCHNQPCGSRYKATRPRSAGGRSTSPSGLPVPSGEGIR